MSCQSLPPLKGVEERAKGLSAGFCRMKAVYGAWLGDRNESERRQPGSCFERVNIRFEVKGLDFQVLVPCNSTTSL